MASNDPEKIREFLADCNRRRHGWAAFQQGTRRSALRMIRNMTEETAMAHYEVRTIDADPTASNDAAYWKNPPEPLHFVYDTVKDRAVSLSSTHDKSAADRHCAELNARA